MKLVLSPDEGLKNKCKFVEDVTPEMVELAKEMYQIMKANKGIGLAANQVGLDMRLIVIEKNEKPLYMFNPSVIRGENPMYKPEGCLSFPGEEKKCRRHQTIAVRYMDIRGSSSFGIFHGLTARCIAHEIDHLDGKTFDEREKK